MLHGGQHAISWSTQAKCSAHVQYLLTCNLIIAVLLHIVWKECYLKQINKLSKSKSKMLLFEKVITHSLCSYCSKVWPLHIL